MSSTRVYTDFHNADEQGRLRLNCVGTIEDLSHHNSPLSRNQLLVLYSEELEVDEVAEYSENERLWVARIDWSKIRELEEAVAMV